MTKVAVAICVYHKDNAEYFLLSLESIFNQTYNSIDVFLFCDGTLTTSHEKIISKFSKRSNFFIYRGEGSYGLANGLNHLIDIIVKLDYEYIARMDSDDLSRPKRIEKQVLHLEENRDIDVCGTSCEEFGASFSLKEKHLPQTHDELLRFSITRCPFIHPSVVFRTAIFSDGIRYPTHTSFTEDMALWLELLCKGYRFSNINEILIDYRLNENTISRRKGIDKGISEFRLRIYYMYKLKQVSFSSLFLISSRLFFHLLPHKVLKFAYAKFR